MFGYSFTVAAVTIKLSKHVKIIIMYIKNFNCLASHPGKLNEANSKQLAQ